jgi:pteridine reductase
MTSGKVALVTGSGKRRVGWHVAEALARQGYRTVVHYRTSRSQAEETATYLQTLGVAAVAVGADLGNEDEVAGLFEQIKQHFDRLDVLVNCAAVWSPKRLEAVTADELRLNFNVNVLGTFLCARAAGLVMVGQEQGGCIITLGDWAVRRPYLNYSPYFASKGAIPTLTRTLAVELGTRNPRVRVNCIEPGPVMLPPDLPPQERQEAIDATLVRREGSPADVARAVLALVDNEFITGVCLPVDGGRSVYARGV